MGWFDESDIKYWSIFPFAFHPPITEQTHVRKRTYLLLSMTVIIFKSLTLTYLHYIAWFLSQKNIINNQKTFKHEEIKSTNCNFTYQFFFGKCPGSDNG